MTETVLSEVKLQTEVVDSASSTDVSMLEPPSIASNIEQLRREILQKRSEIEQLRVILLLRWFSLKNEVHCSGKKGHLFWENIVRVFMYGF